VKELLTRLSPTITVSNDGNVRAAYEEAGSKWLDEVRPALMVYANAHPSAEIREAAERTATAVQQSYAASRWSFSQRPPSEEALSVFESAKKTHEEAQAAVEDLLEKIRDY
jgi:hypothetical protein